MRKLTLAEFIARSRSVHGSFYDYSASDYRGATVKLCISCPKHGRFNQTPDAHFAGKGCPACRPAKAAFTRALKTPEFVKKARAVHGTLYDYSKSDCLGVFQKVEIICPIHGSFWQTPQVHAAMGCGCPLCSRLKRGVRCRNTLEDFVSKAQMVHGQGLYVYDKVSYKGAFVPVELICPAHGSFFQQPTSHLMGHGCPECYRERAGDTQTHTQESFTAKASQAQPAERKFSYDLTGYRNQQSAITVVCPVHGPFKQMAKRHLQGAGCPRCATISSVEETKLYNWIKSLCPDAVAHATGIGRFKLDVLVPSVKLAIEYNGMYWHSCDPLRHEDALRDYRKWEMCKAAGYSLFFVWENDWKTRKPVIEHWLRHKLGKAPRICGARQTLTGMPSNQEAAQFYDQYHLQGAPASCVEHFGLKWNDRWVAMASFSKSPERRIYLPESEYYFARLAFAGSIPGGASKLFKFSVEQLKASKVYAHSDNSYADGDVKALLGFEVVGALPPRYRVWHPRFGIKHRSFWQKSKIAQRLTALNLAASLFSPESSSTFYGHAVCGCRHIWDCGKTRWLWQKLD